jgi:S1/P1 Nuclease
MIRTIHFSLCEEVWRGIIRISPNAFSLRVGFLEQGGQPMDLHRFWDGVITSSSNLTRLRNQATALRTRQEFQRSQLTELATTDFESWAKESFEIAMKIAYRNDGRIGVPKSRNINYAMVTTPPVDNILTRSYLRMPEAILSPTEQFARF